MSVATLTKAAPQFFEIGYERMFKLPRRRSDLISNCFLLLSTNPGQTVSDDGGGTRLSSTYGFLRSAPGEFSLTRPSGLRVRSRWPWKSVRKDP